MLLLPLPCLQSWSPYEEVETKCQTDNCSDGVEPVFTVMFQGSLILICDQSPHGKDEED